MNWNIFTSHFQNLISEYVLRASWGDIAGYAGDVLIVISFFKTTMIPLRALGAMSNLCLVGYGYLDALYPTMVLNAVLFPLNLLRLRQMIKLVRRVRTAAEGNQTMDWLRPYMTRRAARTGEVLFRKGDVADCVFYIASGRYRLKEIGIELPPRAFVGELGLLSPDGKRTQTLECIEAGELLVTTYDQVKMLYFQNPDFGFYFMQLATTRLFHNLELAEQRLAELTHTVAPAQRVEAPVAKA